MGIIKNVPTNYGIVSPYHRIMSVNMDCNQKTLSITYGSYVSEEARKSGNLPISTETVMISMSRLGKDPRTPFYKILEQLESSKLKDGEPDIEVTDTTDFQLEPPINPPLPPMPPVPVTG